MKVGKTGLVALTAALLMGAGTGIKLQQVQASQTEVQKVSQKEAMKRLDARHSNFKAERVSKAMVRNYMKKKGAKLRKKSVRQLRALKKKDQKKAAKYHKKAASYQKQLRVNKNNAAINKQMLANEKKAAKCKTEISAINQILAQKSRGKKAKHRVRKRIPASRKRARKPVRIRRTKRRQINQLKAKVNKDKKRVKSATNTVNEFQDGVNKLSRAQTKKQAPTEAYKQAKTRLQEVLDYIAKGPRIYIPQGYNMDLMEKYFDNKKAYEPQMIKLSEQGLNDPRNGFIPSLADKHEKVNARNLTSDQQKELATYAVQLINDCRDQFGTGQHMILNNSALKFARAVANEYQQNNQGLEEKGSEKWLGHYGPGITRAAQKFGLYTNSNQDNFYEDGGEEHGTLISYDTMADLKGWVYENIKGMLFGNGEEKLQLHGFIESLLYADEKNGKTPFEWYHARDLMGYNNVEFAKHGFDEGKTYFGFCTSMKSSENEEINHYLSVNDGDIIDKSKFNTKDNINVPDLTSLTDQTTMNNKLAELPSYQEAADKAKRNKEKASEEYEKVVDDVYYKLFPRRDDEQNWTVDSLKRNLNDKQNDLNKAKNKLNRDQKALNKLMKKSGKKQVKKHASKHRVRRNK